MQYIDLLTKSALESGNIATMGIDVNPPFLPEKMTESEYFLELFSLIEKEGLSFSAYKPNIGYFSCLDRPLENNFHGSRELAKIISSLPSRPLILDAKRGDIASSSLNYAHEAFSSWLSDATTVSPYMGHDSINPFALNFPEKGIYILNRTSNPGGKDLQNQIMDNKKPLYILVAERILEWNKEYSKNIGAVLGATNLKEFRDIVTLFAPHSIPLLIPGVGSQGGSCREVIAILKEVDYPLALCRINSSSLLTHPWAKKKERAPQNWRSICLKNIESFIKESQL